MSLETGIQRMKKVLIIDYDIETIRFLKKIIWEKLHLPCDTARSMKDAEKLLENPEEYSIALVDVILPDSLDGECIEAVLDRDIPVIAMIQSEDSSVRQVMLQKYILDYINKENPSSFEYAMRLVKFVNGFEGLEILLVDDQSSARLQVKFSLDKLPLTIHEAGNGVEALEVLKEHPKIKLMISDKSMPEMDGITLIQEVRKTHTLNELAIIGISASTDGMTSVEFLKNGANDFINKPFMPEEILSRVITNLEMQHYIRLAEDLAVKDFLTGLHNRKYLYETGEKLYENARREHLSIVVAMLDIDYFKKINDRYGHESGDLALEMLGKLLTDTLRNSDVITRYGGEEFCILLTNTELKMAVEVMENVRQEVESMLIEIHRISFRMSLSIGLNATIGNSFDEMIALADSKLYQAKNEGRNRVVF